MGVWLITGANGGIGLELVQQLAKAGDTVFGTYRSKANSEGLLGLKQKNVIPVQCDIDSEDSIKKAVQSVSQQTGHLDYVFNNAGLNPGMDRSTDFETSQMMAAYNVNVVGPALVVKYAAPLIKKSSKSYIINMTSGLGSIELSKGLGKCFMYSVSKAAVNMVTVQQSHDFPDTVCLSMDPGWVKTRMGGEGATITTDESVSGILKVIKGLKVSDSPSFYSYDGSPRPW